MFCSCSFYVDDDGVGLGWGEMLAIISTCCVDDATLMLRC